MARPLFTPTPAQRQWVATAAGAGVPHAHIARALGISRNTLTRRFRREVTAGAYSRRIDVLVALYGAAMKGRAAAGKQYLRNPAQPLP